jgi:HAD superfamily hydrolase (TIGR01509 family)
VTPPPAEIRAVYFDIGETILDRSREYAAWARWLGVSPHTFSAVFGAVISRGGTVGDVVAQFRPAATRAQLRAELVAAGAVPAAAEEDLYPGAREVLAALSAQGLHVGICGNQPRELGAELRALGLAADAVLVSDELGLAKPDPRFFAALAARAGCRIDALVYVGDQLDDDVRAATDAGAQAIRILSGPWGRLTRDAQLESRCLAVIESLAQLPAALAAARPGRPLADIHPVPGT